MTSVLGHPSDVDPASHRSITADFSADFGPFHGRVWMNAASQGPLPKVAVAAAIKAIEDKVDPRRIEPALFVSTAEDLRASLAALLNASIHEVFLGNSATYGMHVVANALEWNDGDEVLVVAGDYPACAYPWLPLQRHGVRVRAIEPRGRWLEPEELADHLTSSTKLVCTNWVNSFEGHALDIEALADTCHEQDAIFVLNGAQAVGVKAFDATTTNVDVLSGCGYKWLLGPYGTGFGWVASRIRDRLVHDHAYWYAMASDVEGNTETGARHAFRADLEYSPRDDLPTLARLDLFNTPNFLNFIPWRASIEYLLAHGREGIQTHVDSLVERLIGGLPDSYDLISPTDEMHRSSLVVIRPHGQRTPEVHAGLRSSGIDVTHRHGLLRLSPHVYNTASDVDRVLACLARLPA